MKYKLCNYYNCWCIIFLIIFTNSSYTQAQTYFEKIYALGVSGRTLTASDSMIFLSGGTQEGYILRINELNEVVWSTKLTRPNFNLKITSMIISQGNLFVVGNVLDTINPNSNGNYYRNYIVKMDTANGNILSSKIFGDTLDACLLKIGIAIDGNLMAVGYCNWNRSSSGSIKGLTVIFDHLLNFNAITEYQFGNQCTFTDFISFNGHYYITGAISFTNQSNNDICLIKMDTIGNIFWLKNYDEGFGEVGTTICLNTDKLFISGTSVDDVGGSFYGIFTTTIDTSGSVEWYFRHSSSFPLSVTNSQALPSSILLSSGRLVIEMNNVGNIVNQKDLNIYVTDFFYTNNEFNAISNGNLSYFKSDSTISSCYTTTPIINSFAGIVNDFDNLIQMNPYGYFLSGQVTQSLFTPIDSLKCEIHTAIAESPAQNSISIRPNPAQEYIELLNYKFSDNGKYDFHIFDILGNVVKIAEGTMNDFGSNIIRINIAELNSGILVIKDVRSGYRTKFIKFQ